MQIKRSNLAACAAIIVAGMGSSNAARGQIVVNGTYDPSFGAPLAVAQVPTSAGDSSTVAANQGYASGSKLDATYGTIQNNTLYLFFAGNLSTPNQDNLDIFIQTGASQPTAPTSPHWPRISIRAPLFPATPPLLIRPPRQMDCSPAFRNRHH